MAFDEVSAQEGFDPGALDSAWYQNLERYGSCLQLLRLLEEDRSLIHQLGPEGITVLHKGVDHGCVVLVRFILVDMFDERGLCNCGMHGADSAASPTREKLLRKTNSYGSTAVNMAIVSGSPKMVRLLTWAIEMSKRMSGGSTEEMSTQSDQDTSMSRLGYTDIDTIFSTLQETEHDPQIHAESGNDTENELVVPDVKDEDINILDSSDSIMNSKVISVIAGILEDPGEGVHKEVMDMFKERCENDVDFEFVPVAHVFPHFLVTLRVSDDSKMRPKFSKFQEVVLKKIVGACKSGDDGEEGSRGAMLKTLFNILDPRGRPLLHAALLHEKRSYGRFGSFYDPLLVRLLDNIDISSTIKGECMNAKDGGGHTILHFCCISNCPLINMESLDLDVTTRPQSKQLYVLEKWCFPSRNWTDSQYNFKPIQFATLFNSIQLLDLFWPSNRNSKVAKIHFQYGLWPLQLAALLGRITFLERILEHHTKFNSTYDEGLGNAFFYHPGPPAIHAAALFGHVEAIQCILKFRVYDPFIQFWHLGTALHILLNKGSIENRHSITDYKYLKEYLLFHVLPTSQVYKHLQNKFLKFELDEDMEPKMYSPNEISCINLLLQAGIDIWTPHHFTKELPGPGPMANDEARKWWCEKLVNEVVTLKTSISGAANATSVISALVATASFIGPFQPPLGYGDLNGHYVQTDRSPVRIYLVCNSLSFFFSIASILMAVLPAIPMPKESLYDELLRSQRCLKGAAIFLLMAIICILVSFSSASLAVVSSKWQERKFVVGSLICGGVICVGVLVIYIIRLLRMMFHRNDWFRRKFAKHMYF